MPVERVVLNASPLILLCNTGLDFILPALFREMVIPEAVWKEIVKGSHVDKAAQILPELDYLTRKAVEDIPGVVRWDLGAGETAVLSFVATHHGYTAVLDDMLAKKCARSLEIPTMGTGSLLILAKERGVIASVEEALYKLRDAGLWISDAVIRMLKDKAGE